MSFLPLILDACYTSRPSYFLDQHFGMGLDENGLLMSFTIPLETNRLLRVPSFDYLRSWRNRNDQKHIGSKISTDKDKFQVNLDVQHFSLDEISVKVTGDNTITVEAKHEEKQDAHGYISRQFVRKYILPKDHDINQVQSKLSSNGVLTITAPKVNAEIIEDRTISVQQTGVTSESIERKETEKKNNKA